MSLRRKKIMADRPLGKTKRYLATGLSCKGEKTKYFLNHRLVAMAFIKNPEDKPCINHINNKADDNRVMNLEWCSYRENTAHGLIGGKINKNRRGIPTVRIDALQEKAIVTLYNAGISQRKISGLLAISETTINSLLRRKK